MSSLTSYFGGISGSSTGIRYRTLETAWGLPSGSVQTWQETAEVTAPDQVRIHDDLAYFAPSATVGVPVVMGVSPIGDTNWYKKSIVEYFETATDLANNTFNITFFDGLIVETKGRLAIGDGMAYRYIVRENWVPALRVFDVDLGSGFSAIFDGLMSYNGAECGSI